MPADARDRDHAVLERLAEGFQDRAWKLGQLVEQENAAVGERDLARARPRSASDHGRSRRTVMRRPKRRHGDEGTLGWQEPAHRMDASHLERLRPPERWEDSGEPPGEHRLPRPGRTGQKKVVISRGRDLERATSPFLAAHVREIGNGALLERIGKKRVERRSIDLTSEICDDLAEMANGDGLHSGERDLGSRFGSADDPLQPRSPGSFCDRERSGHRPHATVQRELTDRGVLGEPLGRDLPCRGEDCQRDRQIEPRSLLPQRRGREIDGDPAVQRPVERCGDDAASHAVLRLLAGPIGEPDDREPGNAELEMRLDLHLPRLEPDESVGDRACEHPADGRREGVTGGKRLRAERSTSSSPREAEDVHREVARLPGVVAAHGHEAVHLVLRIEERLDLLGHELEVRAVVAPGRACGDRPLGAFAPTFDPSRC